jgi:hypothetical protein
MSAATRKTAIVIAVAVANWSDGTVAPVHRE